MEYTPKEGTFIVTLLSAEFKHNTETFGKMDPYVEFSFLDQTQRSVIIQDGGKYPKWKDQVFSFRANPGDRIKVTAKDDDPGQDDLIMQLELEVQTTD